jgi:hypothetical protein
MFRVPRLDGIDCGPVAHQDRVHPLPKQALRKLRVLPAGADEIAERAEHSTIEVTSSSHQRRGARGEADAITLQLLQCLTPGGELCQRFLSQSSIGPVHRFAFPCFRHEMASVISRCSGSLCFPRRALRILHRKLVGALRLAGLECQAGAVGLGLSGALPQGHQLAFQSCPLSLERFQALGIPLEVVLELPNPASLIG